jgi:hypothetical protein
MNFIPSIIHPTYYEYIELKELLQSKQNVSYILNFIGIK